MKIFFALAVVTVASASTCEDRCMSMVAEDVDQCQNFDDVDRCNAYMRNQYNNCVMDYCNRYRSTQTCIDTCGDKAADGKEQCGDDRECLEIVGGTYKRCVYGCENSDIKPLCEDCSTKLEEGTGRCGDDVECLQNVQDSYKNCMSNCV